MLDRITEPLVDLSPNVGREELLEENAVLKELLETYVAALNKDVK